MSAAIYALAGFGAVALIATCAMAVALWRVITKTEENQEMTPDTRQVTAVAAVMRFTGMSEAQAIRHIEQRDALLRIEEQRRRLAAQACADNYAARVAALNQEKK